MERRNTRSPKGEKWKVSMPRILVLGNLMTKPKIGRGRRKKGRGEKFQKRGRRIQDDKEISIRMGWPMSFSILQKD